MKSKDAIFFDKNVETSVAIVPRVLRLLLPARIKMLIRVQVIYLEEGQNSKWTTGTLAFMMYE